MRLIAGGDTGSSPEGVALFILDSSFDKLVTKSVVRNLACLTSCTFEAFRLDLLGALKATFSMKIVSITNDWKLGTNTEISKQAQGVLSASREFWGKSQRTLVQYGNTYTTFVQFLVRLNAKCRGLTVVNEDAEVAKIFMDCDIPQDSLSLLILDWHLVTSDSPAVCYILLTGMGILVSKASLSAGAKLTACLNVSLHPSSCLAARSLSS